MEEGKEHGQAKWASPPQHLSPLEKDLAGWEQQLPEATSPLQRSTSPIAVTPGLRSAVHYMQ